MPLEQEQHFQQWQMDCCSKIARTGRTEQGKRKTIRLYSHGKCQDITYNSAGHCAATVVLLSSWTGPLHSWLRVTFSFSAAAAADSLPEPPPPPSLPHRSHETESLFGRLQDTHSPILTFSDDVD